MVTCGHLWSLVVTCGHLWSLVVTCGHLWSLVVTCGHLWSFVAVHGGCSSQLVAICGGVAAANVLQLTFPLELSQIREKWKRNIEKYEANHFV